jgi:hypothetical protein
MPESYAGVWCVEGEGERRSVACPDAPGWPASGGTWAPGSGSTLCGCVVCGAALFMGPPQAARLVGGVGGCMFHTWFNLWHCPWDRHRQSGWGPVALSLGLPQAARLVGGLTEMHVPYLVQPVALSLGPPQAIRVRTCGIVPGTATGRQAGVQRTPVMISVITQDGSSRLTGVL